MNFTLAFDLYIAGKRSAKSCLTAQCAAAIAMVHLNGHPAHTAHGRARHQRASLAEVACFSVQRGGNEPMVSGGALGRARGGAGAKRGGGAPAALRQISGLRRARASATCPFRLPACGGTLCHMMLVLQHRGHLLQQGTRAHATCAAAQCWRVSVTRTASASAQHCCNSGSARKPCKPDPGTAV